MIREIEDRLRDAVVRTHPIRIRERCKRDIRAAERKAEAVVIPGLRERGRAATSVFAQRTITSVRTAGTFSDEPSAVCTLPSP